MKSAPSSTRAHVVAIDPQHVLIKDGKGEEKVPASQVFALTGYHPDFEFLEKLGIRLATTNRKPAIDPETLESNIPTEFISPAGCTIGGDDTSHIFIENGRFHGRPDHALPSPAEATKANCATTRNHVAPSGRSEILPPRIAPWRCTFALPFDSVNRPPRRGDSRGSAQRVRELCATPKFVLNRKIGSRFVF